MNLLTQINKFYMIWISESICVADKSAEDEKKLKMDIKINLTRSWLVLRLTTTNKTIQNN